MHCSGIAELHKRMHWKLYKFHLAVLVCLPFFLILTPLQAQDKDQLYVTDRLRLSMYERPDDRSRVVKLLVSGDLLTIEELSGNYALVTTADNVRGWAKRGFLVADPTSNLLLAEELQKNEALQEEVNRLGNAKQVLDQYERDMDALNDSNVSLEQEKSNLQTRVAELEQQVTGQQEEIESLKNTENRIDPQFLLALVKQYWQLLLALLAVLVVIIFLLSKMIIEARIRNHFQGIKVW